MALSRRNIRKIFAGILRSALVGQEKPAAAVYDHQIGDFKGESPVVVVSSAGVKRTRKTFQGSIAEVFLQIDVFTLYADPEAGWTEEDAEDTADQIEALIASAVDGNQANRLWDAISYTDRTSLGSIVDMGGNEYRRETIPIVINAFG